MNEILTEIGNYKIIEAIRKTNYAEIYRVKKNSKVCILKIARESNAELNGLIPREFRVLSQFRHKNIVEVFDYGMSTDKRAYFTSEFIKGVPINQYFKGYSPEFINAMVQVLDALIQFHNRGYFHGDLKPEHILYMPKKRKAVLIDFGFASLEAEWQVPRGTYFYMAPEIIKGLGIDQRSDLYSLGVIMHEILSSQSKLSQKTELKEEPQGLNPMLVATLHDVNPDIPQDISNIVSQLLATEPALRPTTGDVYETLVKCSGKKKIKGLHIKFSLPNLTFVDINEIVSQLGDTEKIRGKTFIIRGDKGFGKTRILNELRFKYLFSGNNVIVFTPEKRKRFFDYITEYLEFSISEREAKDKFEVFEELIQELKAKVNKGLIILIDDLQEFDTFDRDFFRYLGYSIKGTKAIILTFSESNTEFEKMGFENLQLRPFDKTEVQELIKKTFTKIEEDTLADWLYNASGGNPLLIDEILKLLFRENLFYYKENRWHTKSDVLNKIHYPKKIEEVILTKIQELNAEQLEIVRIISLYNKPIEPVILTEMTDMTSHDEVEHLKQTGFIKISHVRGRVAYAIANNIICEIINKDIPQKKQQHLYEKFFKITKKFFDGEPEYIPNLADYAVACNDAPNAYHYSLKAAELKQNIRDFQESIRFFKIATQYAENLAPENLCSLLIRIGELENTLGNTDVAITTFTKAQKYAQDDAEKCKINYNIGLVYQTKGQYSHSIEYFNKAVSLIEEKSIEYVNILNNLSYSLIYLGKFSEARSLLEGSLRIAEAVKTNELESKTFYLLAVLEWFCKDYDKGVEIAKTALKIAHDNKNLRLYANCYGLLGSLYQQKGDFKKAEESYSYTIELLQSLKDINALISAITNFSLSLKVHCKFEKATQLLYSALNYAKKVGNSKVIASILGNLANIYEIKGDFDRAVELNRQAMEIDNTVENPVWSLAMLYYRKGDIAAAEKILESAVNICDSPSYYFTRALVSVHSGKIIDAEFNIKEGFEIIAVSGADFFKKTGCYLKAIEFYYDIKKYDECYFYAAEALNFLSPDSREYILVDAILKLCSVLTNRSEIPDINTNLNSLKKLDCLFDWAYLKRMEIEAQYEKYGKSSIGYVVSELVNIEEILKKSGAKLELEKIQKIKDLILKEIGELTTQKSISLEYLRFFHQISEIIINCLGQDDFVERILDVLISATRSERGALFLIEGSKIILAAGRNVDHETIKDAKKVSRSVIKETRRQNEIIYSLDALSDDRFKDSGSVILNKIRSLMCTPLRIGVNTIGAIYLDSTNACNLFSNEDKDFLLTVTNFMASTIEQSKIFQKIREENICLKMGVLAEWASEYLIGESLSIKEIRDTIEKVAKTDSTILITGETGSGKGLIARLIHQKSIRKNGRFVTVSCGGLQETLFESELFGYKKGAFTGAVNDKRGLFEEADGGTLFLDEISNAPLAIQGKLLEAIEEKKIRRLGETTERKIDVRLISATNRNLEQMIKQGLFRDDLFYRISVLTIHVAPLRERTIDILILADYFLKKYASQMNRNILGFDKKTINMILKYPWFGNVRELRNAIERAVILAKSEYILPEDLKLKTEIIVSAKQMEDNKEKIINALKIAKGNITLASKFLGVARCTLYRYIKKHNINIS